MSVKSNLHVPYNYYYNIIAVICLLHSQQSSLKSTFFKQPSLKATAAMKTPTPPLHDGDSEPGVAAANDRDKPTQDGADAVEDKADDHMTTGNGHVTPNGDIAESVKQNSKQRLADLAFKPASEP